MRLEKEKVRAEKLYRVGYIACIDKYVLVAVVPWIAWYDRFFEITENEYLLYDTDPEKLDALANELYDLGNLSERFLFAEKKDENSPQQAMLQQKCAQHARSVTKNGE